MHLISAIAINVCAGLERDCGMHRLLGCLQPVHLYLYIHTGSEMLWMRIGNTDRVDIQEPIGCSLGCFPNALIVYFHGGSIHCKTFIDLTCKWRCLDREGISGCPGEHSSLIKPSKLLKKKMEWIFRQNRYVVWEDKGKLRRLLSPGWMRKGQWGCRWSFINLS